MLKVHTRSLGNVTVLCLQGRIVNGEAGALRHAVSLQTEARTIVLDLSGVSTIDARGLGLMLELRKQTESKGVRFKLMNTTKLVSRVLEITRLDSVFEVIPKAEVLSKGARTRPAQVLNWASCA